MKLETLCFEEGGPQNTAATLDHALKRALALGIKQVVVASSHGGTALEAATRFGPHSIKVIAVSIGHGWDSLGWCMTPQERAKVEAAGVQVVTGIHALGDGIGSAFSEKHGGRAPEEIVRQTLYTFCQGMKVAVECILMAAEAGLLDMEQEVIGIAGSSEGADTAIVCLPAYPRTYLDLRVREILAKPRLG
ncbi:MAG: hypothetical protein GXY68_07520 [Chloroflexi bacterium]|jgi:hypothetical protein|nr:hypothetical protein [Chloroflexota bacterium]